MAQLIPGEYSSPRLRKALSVARLANAEHVRSGGSGMRYIVDAYIHEAIDPDRLVRILDSVDGSFLSVADLLARLPEDSRKRLLFS